MTDTAPVSTHLVAGTPVTMPVRIRRATQHMAMFSVDADAAQRLVDHSGLRVCRYRPRRAVVVLMLMHYLDGDLGQYLEYGTNVMVAPPGASVGGLKSLLSAGAFVHHLPVDQAFTLAAGRSIWGYPKVMADFTIRSPGRSAPARRIRNGRHFGFDVSIDGQFAIGMDFRPGVPAPPAWTSRTRRHPTYSHLDGVTRETVGEMTPSGVRFRPGGVRVRLGEHPYARDLASLGLPKRAMFSMSADNVEMTFGDATEVA